MKRYALLFFCLLLLINLTSCHTSWQHTSGSQLLPAPNDRKVPYERRAADSYQVVFNVPEGWHWFVREDDLMMTRDGVFLQNIYIERACLDRIQEKNTHFISAPWSAMHWPIRSTYNYTPGMTATHAAGVMIGNCLNNPALSGVEIQEQTILSISGYEAFRLVFDFRFKRQSDFPTYRSVYYGFIVDGWFYGLSYTAPLRYYFQKDLKTFGSVADSIQLKSQREFNWK